MVTTSKRTCFGPAPPSSYADRGRRYPDRCTFHDMFAPAHGDRRRSIHGKTAFRAPVIFPVVRWRSGPLGARREVVRFCGAGTGVASRSGPRTDEAFRHTWAWRQYTPPWPKKQAARVTAPRGLGNATTRGFAKRKVACFRWSRRFNAQARDHWIVRLQCPPT